MLKGELPRGPLLSNATNYSPVKLVPPHGAVNIKLFLRAPNLRFGAIKIALLQIIGELPRGTI